LERREPSQHSLLDPGTPRKTCVEMAILIVNLMSTDDDPATSVKYGGNRRTGFIWLRTATSDELFMNTVITFKFPKRREILLDER
jgi:hypothetical protein